MKSMISDRKAQILESIIEEYITSAMPVSSGRVFDICDMGVSCPTIRNEMADLTDLGYLEQPHTSAGRVPTEKGYRFFVNDLLEKFGEENGENVKNTYGSQQKIFNLKSFADNISNEVKAAVIFSNDYRELKFVGLKQVFENPEFSTCSDVISFIEEIEGLENYLGDILDSSDSGVKVFIGSENPFFERHNYSMISRAFGNIFISIVGPMRMDYEKSISIFDKLIKTL
ncbi:MAG: hypothetical protein A3B96_00035 [Candidatus Spechtbacteria bacterium RIFCSPHIGHO2_02_FULL_43_15b]|uniref:Heat-inducible transcription repressor HrcA C-terminal domain-containing protein n=1 Tax=Candidatus Spechtbacteria bacterium RIFCSPHIGHO2_01_FULL_43_30 TaxID=1802158 RepID=A0A1G2H7E4_9BACT|nr:MAG: hypothetical protein A2827_02485 [Candidatus Spechtbacteria bacterium RIFCSPHIGHO2_01_FULL_43_30]OGZ60333.1 MAG: hypothetical protein A3B96_00035 [Candidatus Spechtbacteria bacterium RIFCSPHIGHO2_02_FULL_43_15b]